MFAPVDAEEEGATDDIFPGAVSVLAKTTKSIQVGAAKTTPRRVMDNATVDRATSSGKPATNV